MAKFILGLAQPIIGRASFREIDLFKFSLSQIKNPTLLRFLPNTVSAKSIRLIWLSAVNVVSSKNGENARSGLFCSSS